MNLGNSCENTDIECPICMSNIVPIGIITTICGHKFHINCLKSWNFQQCINNLNNSCPICRQDIDERHPNIIYWEGTNNIKIIRNKDFEKSYDRNGILQCETTI